MSNAFEKGADAKETAGEELPTPESAEQISLQVEGETQAAKQEGEGALARYANGDTVSAEALAETNAVERLAAVHQEMDALRAETLGKLREGEELPDMTMEGGWKLGKQGWVLDQKLSEEAFRKREPHLFSQNERANTEIPEPQLQVEAVRAAIPEETEEVREDDERYAGLANSLFEDPEYQSMKSEIERQQKLRVYGVEDLSTLTPHHLAEGSNSERNLGFDADEQARNQFRSLFGEKFNLYEKRERTRIYRDEKGNVDPSRDPAFKKIQSYLEHQSSMTREEYGKVEMFQHLYPKKIEAYAGVSPGLKSFIEERARYQNRAKAA